MRNLNRVELIGRLGREPEVRYTQSGLAVCTMSVATEHRTKKGSDWEGKTTWHNVVAWRDLAERASNLNKGDLVYIQGRLNQESWEKNGETRYTVKIIADTIFLCEELRKNEDGADRGWPDHDSSGFPQDGPDDDLPF